MSHMNAGKYLCEDVVLLPPLCGEPVPHTHAYKKNASHIPINTHTHAQTHVQDTDIHRHTHSHADTDIDTHKTHR